MDLDKIIGCCGLVCSECPGFVATQKDDDEERRKVAEFWTKKHGGSFRPEDINCDGCMTESKRKLGYTVQCPIRKCGVERGVLNCGHCDEYACEKLEDFFKSVPNAKTVLDEVKSSL